MSGSDKRNGKPTAFQVAALKKAGLTLKGIKTYRDAENALRRMQRKAKVKKAAAKNTKVPPVKMPNLNKAKCKYSEAMKKADEADKIANVAVKKDNKRPTASKSSQKPCDKAVAGIGVFKVRVAPLDVVEALLVGFAKSVLSVYGDVD